MKSALLWRATFYITQSNPQSVVHKKKLRSLFKFLEVAFSFSLFGLGVFGGLFGFCLLFSFCNRLQCLFLWKKKE